MRYLITANLEESDLPRGVTAIARGRAISLEQPWPFGRVLISRVEESRETGLAKLNAIPNIVAFSVRWRCGADQWRRVRVRCSYHEGSGGHEALYRGCAAGDRSLRLHFPRSQHPRLHSCRDVRAGPCR